MTSLKPAFNQAQTLHHGLNPLLLLFWAVAIDEDAQRREKERRRKDRIARQAQQRRELKQRLPAPRPF